MFIINPNGIPVCLLTMEVYMNKIKMINCNAIVKLAKNLLMLVADQNMQMEKNINLHLQIEKLEKLIKKL